MNMRQVRYQEAILEATDQMMEKDPSVYVMGLGVPDPKGIFGTTSGLQNKYGSNRVMDMPTSENAMTGIAIGSAIAGMRPIMTHQRVDFFILALDQLINNAAKWHYMFNNLMSVPIVIRLIIGRGWGQGPQHSQSLQGLFAHIPGLKVVMPSNSYDAKGLLISAIEDMNPVVYLEHRWLHGVFGEVPQEIYRVPIGKAKILQKGTDLTLVASSHMTLEAWRAVQHLNKEAISVELIDVRSIRPLDEETILTSIEKTGRLIVADPDWRSFGFASEVLAIAVERVLPFLKCSPVRITYPDRMVGTSWKLSNHYYPTEKHLISEIFKMMGRSIDSMNYYTEILKQADQEPLDIPNKEFSGPF